MEKRSLNIAVLSIHSCPMAKLGTRYNGGMSVYVRELGKELGEQGHGVDIYTGFQDEEHPGVMDLGQGVRVIHLSAGRREPCTHDEIYSLLPEYFSELESCLEKDRRGYDLVHSHYWLSAQMGEWARERWNLPHFFMFHTIGAAKNQSHSGEKEPALRLRVEKELAHSCTRILATTEKEKRLIARHCRVSEEKIGVVPAGVNLKRFPLSDRVAARSRLGLTGRDSILLFAGRFTPIKGIDRLVAAMANLKHRGNISLVLVGGDGAEAPETLRLKNLARELGVDKKVVFVGRVPQESLPMYYAAADGLVIPSFYESFGLVALESLACGTPVLATSVGAMETLLRDGSRGRIIPDTSPSQLAESIEEFLSGIEGPPPPPP